MSEHAIAIEDLTVSYDTSPVIWDLDVAFEKAKLTAIVGPNGAGKSTLIKTIMRLIKPVSGSVTLCGGKDVSAIAYVPQSGSVDWDFPATVEDIVLMGRYGRLGWCKRPREADRRIANHMIERVGMQAFKKRQISQVSGGQQQRVFLARALCQQPDIYILDEPLKGVDIKTEEILMQLLRELTREGKTVIAVHHDVHTVKKYFQNVVFINVRLIGSGPVATVFTQENLLKTYGSMPEELSL